MAFIKLKLALPIIVFRSESFPKPLKLISFADVIGRKPTTPNVTKPTNTESPKLDNRNRSTPNKSSFANLGPTSYNNRAPRHLASPNAVTPKLVPLCDQFASPKPTLGNERRPDSSTTSPNPSARRVESQSLPPTASGTVTIISGC